MGGTFGDGDDDDILAVTADQLCRLTGLTRRQLSYWDKTGFFSPHYAEENGRAPYSRVYSFRDLVGLRTVASLRETVSLQELRKIGAWLKERYHDPWSSLTFYVRGRQVFFTDPGSGDRITTRPPGQMVLPIEMAKVAAEMRVATKRLRERVPEQIGRVEQKRSVLSNTPVLAGTRIPTAAVWDFHQAGYDTAGIIKAYPQLTETDIRAALAEESRRRQKTG